MVVVMYVFLWVFGMMNLVVIKLWCWGFLCCLIWVILIVVMRFFGWLKWIFLSCVEVLCVLSCCCWWRVCIWSYNNVVLRFVWFWSNFCWKFGGFMRKFRLVIVVGVIVFLIWLMLFIFVWFWSVELLIWLRVFISNVMNWSVWLVFFWLLKCVCKEIFNELIYFECVVCWFVICCYYWCLGGRCEWWWLCWMLGVWGVVWGMFVGEKWIWFGVDDIWRWCFIWILSLCLLEWKIFGFGLSRFDY